MHPFLRKLAACISLILLAIWYAKTHFYRDPGSAFFDRERAYEQIYSRYRKAEVQRFIDDGFTSLDVAENGLSKNTTLCVAFSSVKRQHEQYLETTVGSMLAGLTPHERESLHVAILIAQTNPETHPAWSSKWLHGAVDELYTYNTTASELERLADLEDTGAYAEKGIFDYTYAMQHCYDTGAPYIGVFEDDILLADGWLVRTRLGIKKHIEPSPTTNNNKNPWLFLRLFNQERSTGWSNTHFGGNNEHYIVLVAGTLIATCTYLLRRQGSGFARTYLTTTNTALLTLLLLPAFTILFFQSGKASLLPPSPGIFAQPYGCCSQAMVFPRAVMPRVISYLRAQTAGQVDLLLDELAVEDGLTRYALYPVQAQHIGLDSARMTAEREAQAIWSMAFEGLDPRVLAREHGGMVREYFGG